MTRASKPSTLSKLSRSYPHTASMSSAQTSRKVESSLRPQASNQYLASEQRYIVTRTLTRHTWCERRHNTCDQPSDARLSSLCAFRHCNAGAYILLKDSLLPYVRRASSNAASHLKSAARASIMASNSSLHSALKPGSSLCASKQSLTCAPPAEDSGSRYRFFRDRGCPTPRKAWHNTDACTGSSTSCQEGVSQSAAPMGLHACMPGISYQLLICKGTALLRMSAISCEVRTSQGQSRGNMGGAAAYQT